MAEGAAADWLRRHQTVRSSNAYLILLKSPALVGSAGVGPLIYFTAIRS